MLDDDPIEVDLQENENLDVVINPKFTKRNFGLNGESQIHFE